MVFACSTDGIGEVSYNCKHGAPWFPCSRGFDWCGAEYSFGNGKVGLKHFIYFISNILLEKVDIDFFNCEDIYFLDLDLDTEGMEFCKVVVRNNGVGIDSPILNHCVLGSAVFLILFVSFVVFFVFSGYVGSGYCALSSSLVV